MDNFPRFTQSIIGLSLVVLAGAGCSNDGTGPDAAPVAYLAADGVNGGRLYDQFWAVETGFSQSDPNLAAFRAQSDFFRCKQCHGWDRLGTAGGYVNRGPRTSRPNVSSINLAALAATSTPQQLFDGIKRSQGRRAPNVDVSTYHPTSNSAVGDQMPDYAQILTDQQVWEVVKFLKAEAFDVSELYDAQVTGTYPTGTITYSNLGRDGDAARGDTFFVGTCAYCHGSNGSSFLVDGGAFTVGRHLRSKPYEDAHKIRFGQLGTSMSNMTMTLSQMKDLYKALANSTKYPD